MAFDLTKLTAEKIEEAAKNFMNLGTVRETKGITDAEMEAMYSLGFSFYQTGRYDDAEKVFRFLVLFDHLSAKYWTSLGAVLKMKKMYTEAVSAFSFGSFLDLANPKPQFFAAECFLALGDKENALSALDALEQFCPVNTETGREYRAKAKQLRESITA